MTFKDHYQLFEEFFTGIEGAVKHIDHLEENILTQGKAGIDEALAHIKGACDHFIADSTHTITLKADGAPSIVAGLDNNKRFFVATKAAFTKSPKLNYTNDDIDRNHSDQVLAEKLKLALKYLPELQLKSIYQMDYMFDNNIKQFEQPTSIDNVANHNRFVAFQPNTIKYACTPDSPHGSSIIQAKIGVAIHVEYEVVNGILRVKKHFTKFDEFTPSTNVFVYNVLVDKPGTANNKVVNMVIRDLDKRTQQVKRLEQRIDFDIITKYAADLKVYINSEVRSGQFLENAAISTENFIAFMEARGQTEITKLKSERGRETRAEKLKTTIRELKHSKKSIRAALDITKIIANLKNNLIKLFNELTRSELIGTYIETAQNQWETTNPEGYAVSDNTNRITKLVNRQEFSASNFNNDRFSKPIKENHSKTACIAYGRMNPVTIGHEKLIERLSNTASKMGCDCFLAPSHTQNDTKDPLNYEEKTELLQLVCPGNVKLLDAGKNFIMLLQQLMELGYKDIVQVAGSDRIGEFKAIIDQYNGKPNKAGMIPFTFNSYNFESAGERDPDSDGVEGISASKVRNAAKSGDYSMFRAGLSPKISEQMAQKTFELIRSRIK